MDDDWHHIALVVDHTNQKARFYLDGQLVLNREVSNFTLASEVSGSGNYRYLKIGDGGDGNNKAGLQDVAIDEFRITRRALVPQEFLMAGAAVELEPTRTWFRFENDLSAEPSEGAIPAGQLQNSVNATFSDLVYGNGQNLIDGNGNVLCPANTKSMYFSGATTSSANDKRIFFDRNLLLEKDMSSMTVEFFMKGTKGAEVPWATFIRMYNNATGADTGGERLWSIGYAGESVPLNRVAGSLYVGIDNGSDKNADWQLKYPVPGVSIADGRWHHIAVTFAPDGNGNTVATVYKDYVPYGAAQTFSGAIFTYDGEPIDLTNTRLAIGARYNGYIDEVRISKGVLTVAEMQHVEKNGSVILIR